MDISAELKRMNEQLEKIWEVIQQHPNRIGFASDMAENKSFKRKTTKEDIRNKLINNWNKEHPYHQINLK